MTLKIFLAGSILLLLATNAGAVTVEENNKKIVAEFFQKFSKGDPAAFALIHPQVTWWVPETLPFGKQYTSAKDYFSMLRTTFAGFPKGLSLDVKSMIAEGDHVAAEVESNATHICDEFHYNNHYHFKITVKNGQFIDVKEYNDTKHLLDLYDLTQSESCQIEIKKFYAK